MQKNHLFSKCASGLLSFSLILASIPSVPAVAEEAGVAQDDVIYEESAEDGTAEAPTDEAAEAQEVSSVFYITRYAEFDKAEDGTFIDEEIEEKYGSLTAEPGTASDELGLPESLEVEGYWAADGPEVPSVMTLEHMEWKLKTDTEEVYSEATPEGTYTFLPDYESWLMTTDGIDGIELAEGVEELELTVEIAASPAETEAITEALSADAAADDGSYSEEISQDAYAEDGSGTDDSSQDAYVDDSFDSGDVSQDSYVDNNSDSGDSSQDIYVDDGSGSGDISQNSYADDGTYSEDSSQDIYVGDGSGSGDSSSDVSAEEDVFANLDPSAISVETTENMQESEGDDGVILLSDEDGSETDAAETEDTQATETVESDTTASETPATEAVVDSEAAASESTETSESSESTAASEEETSSVETEASTIDGTLQFLSDENGTPGATILNASYETLTYVSITNGQTDAVTISDLQCGTDLSSLYVLFTDSTGSVYANVIPANAETDTQTALDFSSGDAVPVKMTVSGIEYDFSLAVGKTSHNMTSATCLQPATCSVCGYEEGDTTAHISANDETCTTNAHCSVCGEEIADTATGHTSANNATCTANATCSVCGAEIANTALGHNWTDATCTEPKTCSRCGITEGSALGHSSADNATCTKNATCSRCGEEIENTALGHDWVAATCTEPKTCSRCNATEGSSLGHDLQDDWETISESTESEHGTQERYCHRDSCDYYESRDLNIVGNPDNNSIQGLTEGANYDLNTRLSFTAVGAGMSNSDPIDGDVRYVPSAWSIQGTAGSWLDNYSGAFSISKSGTYTLTVTFQKQVYSGGWSATDIADSKSVTFTVGGTSTDGSDDAVRINPTTGDTTQILPFVIALAAALIVIILVTVYKKKRK